MIDHYGDFRAKLYSNEYRVTHVKREIAGRTWTAEQNEIATQWMRERLERFNDWVSGEIAVE